MSYQVHVEPSGHQFVLEAGETVLDGALRQGLAFPYGCRDGACGSCKGKVITGQVSYPGNALPAALSQAEHAAHQALFCQAVAGSDLRIEVQELRSAQDIPIKKLPCRAAKLEHLAPDVMRVYLKLPNTQRLQFLAGQYLDILLSDGRRRAFSIANAPHEDEFIELHIRLIEGGEFTQYVFSQLQEKALLRIEGPRGSFFLREESALPIIFMAGGTGFAPIKGIIEHAIAEGMTRPMYLYWGARAKIDLYLDTLAQGWAQRYPHIHYIPVLSAPVPEDHWQGHTGLVHQAVLEDFPEMSGYEVYTSGPPAMVKAGQQAFTAHGLDPAHFFSDAFEFATDQKKAGR